METFLKTLPIAHRGLHDEALPENSIPAFRAAVEAGYAIETDVHFSKDGKLIVFHDDNLYRMTGDKRNVSGCTLAELRALRLAGTDAGIPTFEELLDEVAGKVPLLIEIKSMKGVEPDRIAGALADALEGYRGSYAVQSFQPFYVKAYKELRPDIACGLLATKNYRKGELGKFHGLKQYLLGRLKLAKHVRADFVSYNAHYLPAPWVTKFKGIKLAWTVRSKEEEEAVRPYVDNIIFEGYRAGK